MLPVSWKKKKSKPRKKINTFHWAATSLPNKSRPYLFIKLCDRSLVGSIFNEWQLFDVIDSYQDAHLADKRINHTARLSLAQRGMFVRTLLEQVKGEGVRLLGFYWEELEWQRKVLMAVHSQRENSRIRFIVLEIWGGAQVSPTVMGRPFKPLLQEPWPV